MTRTERTLVVDAHPLLVRDDSTEDPTLPVVVCHHGAVGLASDWDGVAAELAGVARVVAIGRVRRAGCLDHAAQGRSLLDDLGVARAVQVGHSMGGMVAELSTRCWPTTVSGLVLVDASVPQTPTRRAWVETAAYRVGGAALQVVAGAADRLPTRRRRGPGRGWPRSGWAPAKRAPTTVGRRKC